MLRLLLLVLFLILGLFLAFENRTEIPIAFLFGYVTDPIPLYLVVVIAFLLGALIALLWTLPPWVRNKVEIRRLRRTIQNLEEHDNRKGS